MKTAHTQDALVYKFHFNAVKYFKPDLADNNWLLPAPKAYAFMLWAYKWKKHDKKVRRLSVFFFFFPMSRIYFYSV